MQGFSRLDIIERQHLYVRVSLSRALHACAVNKNMAGLYFEEYKIGDTFETSRRTVTEADVVNFAALSGDYNPLHTDEEFAKASLFNRRIAHGVLTLSILTGLIDKLGVTSYKVEAFYGIDNLRFTKPVFFGDTIHAKITVSEKQERDRNGIVTLDSRVINQTNETVLACKLKLVVVKKKK